MPKTDTSRYRVIITQRWSSQRWSRYTDSFEDAIAEYVEVLRQNSDSDYPGPGTEYYARVYDITNAFIDWINPDVMRDEVDVTDEVAAAAEEILRRG